jgi:hypothetical protein
MELFTLDLVLLVGFVCAVFGFGSAVLVLWHRTNIDAFHHPWHWFRTTYTATRWLTNPFKVCEVALLWQANFQQLALTGPIASMAGDLDYRSRLYLTLANLIGGGIAFYGLHLRDFEMSLWVEVCAYISLIGTLGWWVVLVYLTVPLPNTSYGLNSIEAFIIAAFIRSALVLRYKRALRRGADVPRIARLRLILGGDVGRS